MAAFNVGAGLLSGVLVVTGSHLVQPFDKVHIALLHSRTVHNNIQNASYPSRLFQCSPHASRILYSERRKMQA